MSVSATTTIPVITPPVPPNVIHLTKSQPVKGKKALPVITYTAKKFAELFRAQNDVEFPANTRIKILHIDPLLGGKVQLAEAGVPKYEKLLKVFEDILLLEAKTVTGIQSITQKEFKYSIEIGTNRSNCSLIMYANKKFSLATEHGEIHTNVHRLLAKMQYDQISTFTIQPNQLLTLHKVPKAIINSFITLKKKTLIAPEDYLSLSSPPGYVFSLQASHLQSDFYHESRKRLTLSAANGMKMLLEKTSD